MSEVFLLILMFLGIVSGYFLSKIANEELKELHNYIKYAYIISSAAIFATAAYTTAHFNFILSIIVFFLIFILLFIFNNSYSQKIVLFVSGVLIFFININNIFIYSVFLFISILLITTLNYDKHFFKNVAMYGYFFIPALLFFLLINFMNV